MLTLNAKQRQFLVRMALTLMTSILLFFFARHDSVIYTRPIAQVTAVTNSHTQSASMGTDMEATFNQSLKLTYLNTKEKGQSITLSHDSSRAQVFNEYYAVKDQVFLKTGPDGKLTIAGLKRDASLIYIISLFAFAMVLVGGRKGLLSFMSVIFNLLLFALLIWLYLSGVSLYFLAPISTLLFVPLSICLVSGLNAKSFSAVLGTLVGAFTAVAIALIVIHFTGSKGVHYEEMEFLTRSPVEIFVFGLLIGTLGAIMDIAISISSFVEEMLLSEPRISSHTLLTSGLTVGNDIVGTMANTLMLAAIAGTLPTMLLYLYNGFSITYLLKVSLSLELIRALVGSIGIVISIPITLSISIWLAKKRQQRTEVPS